MLITYSTKVQLGNVNYKIFYFLYPPPQPLLLFLVFCISLDCDADLVDGLNLTLRAARSRARTFMLA